MAWNDDERAIEVSPFRGAAIKTPRATGKSEWYSLSKICKQIVKESADPYKIMPAPLPQEDTDADAFDEPYYCAKSPSMESFNMLSSEEPEESVSSSCEEDVEPNGGGRCGEDADTPNKSADPKPFFYT
jgi:hypothetical protein